MRRFATRPCYTGFSLEQETCVVGRPEGVSLGEAAFPELKALDVGNRYRNLSNPHRCGQMQLALQMFKGHRKEDRIGFRIFVKDGVQVQPVEKIIIRISKYIFHLLGWTRDSKNGFGDFGVFSECRYV